MKYKKSIPIHIKVSAGPRYALVVQPLLP